jgi:hypothetical protein
VNVVITERFFAVALGFDRMPIAPAVLNGAGSVAVTVPEDAGVAVNAKVFEAVAITQTFRTLAIQVGFECSPYAYGAEITMPVAKGSNPVSYAGNIKTPTLIILRNEGAMNVESINITAVVRVTGKGTR